MRVAAAAIGRPPLNRPRPHPRPHSRKSGPLSRKGEGSAPDLDAGRKQCLPVLRSLCYSSSERSREAEVAMGWGRRLKGVTARVERARRSVGGATLPCPEARGSAPALQWLVLEGRRLAVQERGTRSLRQRRWGRASSALRAVHAQHSP